MIILDDYCKHWQKHDNLKTKISLYKLQYFSPGSKRLDPDTKYNDLIGTITAFNCLYLGHYFSDRAEICLYLLFESTLSEIESKVKTLCNRFIGDVTQKNSSSKLRKEIGTPTFQINGGPNKRV